MTIERELRALQSKVQRLESELHRQPVVDWFGGGNATPSYLWVVEGGNTIPASGRTGIARRSPATVISPSELPDGAPGTGIIVVPAWPIPALLPNGIGVISKTDTGGNISYAFYRIDLVNPYGNQDLSAGEEIYIGGSTNLDKVSGGTTWRYTCYNGPYGYY